MKVKSENEFAQSCLTLSDPMGHSLPGSSVHVIFQARVLDLGANYNLFQRPRRVDVLSTYPLPRYSGHVFWWQGVGGSLPALVPLFLCLVPVFL